MKLKPKGKGETNTTINSIASLIRKETNEPRYDVVETIVTEPEASNPKTIKKTTREEKEAFEELTISTLENVDKDRYNCKGQLYIDNEIKEVFSLLKQKGKIQTSLLVSVILEKWLEENKEEVQTIINNGTNRFL